MSFIQLPYIVNEDDETVETALIFSNEVFYSVTFDVNATSGTANGKWYVVRLLLSSYTLNLKEQDFDLGPHTVTFPARTTIVYLSVSIRNDNIVEGDENFTLTIDPSSLPNDIFIDNYNETTVTIANDDCKFTIYFIYTRNDFKKL